MKSDITCKEWTSSCSICNHVSACHCSTVSINLS